MDRSPQALKEELAAAFSTWLLRIYRRPLLFLIVIVAFPILFVVSTTYRFNVSVAREQALNNLHLAAQLAAEAVDETLHNALAIEELLASRPEVAEAFAARDRALVTAALERTLPFLPRADLIIGGTEDGTVLSAVPENAVAPGISLADDEAVRAARDSGWQSYISPVHIRDEQSLEKVVDVVVPVRHEGQVVGVLKLQFLVEAVRSWIQRVRVDPEGFLYVVDQRSQLVVFPFQVLPGRPKVVADWPTVASPLTAAGHSMSFFDAKSGKRWLAGVYPVGAIGWRVVAVQREGAVLRVLYRLLLPLAALIAILLVMVIAVSLRWAALQALNLRLLQQNAKLLKQSQQRWSLERGKPPSSPEGSGGS